MTDDKKTSGSSVELPAGGIPGLPQELQVVFGYADGDQRNEPPGGKPGKYKLVFTLSRPGIRPLAEYANSFDRRLKGDSRSSRQPTHHRRCRPRHRSASMTTPKTGRASFAKGFQTPQGFYRRS
jgi:hypothetical protein